jgi:hypothetical protein
MAGGLLQLASMGAQNVHLIGNPHPFFRFVSFRYIYDTIMGGGFLADPDHSAADVHLSESYLENTQIDSWIDRMLDNDTPLPYVLK